MSTTTMASDNKYNNKTKTNFKDWQRSMLRTLDKHPNKLLLPIVLNAKMDTNYKARLIVTLRQADPTKYTTDATGNTHMKKMLVAEAKNLNRSAFYTSSPTPSHTSQRCNTSSAPATVTATRPTITSSRSGRLTPTNASRPSTAN
jgi:hypothetical protein